MVLGGPLGRIIVQVVIPVIATLVRAIPAAYGQALQNARRSGAAAEAASAVTRKRISKDEAMQILNLSTEQEITPAAIQKVGSCCMLQELYRMRDSVGFSWSLLCHLSLTVGPCFVLAFTSL